MLCTLLSRNLAHRAPTGDTRHAAVDSPSSPATRRGLSAPLGQIAAPAQRLKGQVPRRLRWFHTTAAGSQAAPGGNIKLSTLFSGVKGPPRSAKSHIRIASSGRSEAIMAGIMWDDHRRAQQRRAIIGTSCHVPPPQRPDRFTRRHERGIRHLSRGQAEQADVAKQDAG